MTQQVLILEDNSALAETFRQALGDDFEVDIADTMASCREMLRRSVCAAVVCDLFIRGDVGATSSTGGLTLIHALRSEGNNFQDWRRTVPIVAISGASEINGADSRQVAIDAGATKMLRKPFTPEELLTTVKAAIEQAPKRRRFGIR